MSDPVRTLLENASAAVVVPEGDVNGVIAGGRKRRLMAVAISSVAVVGVALGALTLFGSGPRDSLQPARFPVPPASIADQLPDELDEWVRPGLVLAYENEGVFDLFFEGVVGHSCPMPADEKHPDACISTGTRITWGEPSQGLRMTGSHDLRIVPPPTGADVLWRGVPAEGSIGAESPGACDRIERFDGLYECKNDRLVYVGAEEEGLPSPSFDIPRGWFTDSSGTLPLDTDDQPGAWASTYDFSQPDYMNLYPRLEELPVNGIAIEATIVAAEDFPHEPNPNFPLRDLPLDLAESDIQEEWEGQPGQIPRYRILANVDGELVEVDVYFGHKNPTRGMRESAARVLRTLQLPRAESATDDSESVTGIDGRIAFLSEQGQGCCFRLFATEGPGDVRRVNNVYGYGSRLDWSPDGRSILMDRGLSEGHGALVITDVDSGEERVLFSDEGAPRPIDPQSPSWSPDGDTIAFSSGAGDIYVMDLDDREPRIFASSPRTCGYTHPSWSPDGAAIAFANGCRAAGGITIAPTDGGPADGASQRRVTGERRDSMPSWSPDGSKIAFTRSGPEGNQIVVVAVAKGTERVLTEETDSYSPSWSPDGSQIVFGSNRTGHQNIWVMDSDGSDEFSLTTGRETSIAPAWGPRR